MVTPHFKQLVVNLFEHIYLHWKLLFNFVKNLNELKQKSYPEAIAIANKTQS